MHFPATVRISNKSNDYFESLTPCSDTIRTHRCPLRLVQSFKECRIRPVKRPKLRLWLLPILSQLRFGKEIFHSKFWASGSEIAGTFVRMMLKCVFNQHWNQYFYHTNFVSAVDLWKLHGHPNKGSCSSRGLKFCMEYFFTKPQPR